MSHTPPLNFRNWVQHPLLSLQAWICTKYGPIILDVFQTKVIKISNFPKNNFQPFSIIMAWRHFGDKNLGRAFHLNIQFSQAISSFIKWHFQIKRWINLLNTLFVQIVCGRNSCGTNFCEFGLQKIEICGTYFCEFAKSLGICGVYFWKFGKKLKK